MTQNASHVTITNTFVTPVIIHTPVPSTTMSEQAAIGKLNSNSASKYVDVMESVLCTNLMHSGTLLKLIIFSLSLGIVPLTSYYASLHLLWSGILDVSYINPSTHPCLGNSTFAAITAIVAANVVLILYIISSILEDNSSKQSPSRISLNAPESKKEQ